MNRVEELINNVKLAELLKKKEEEKKVPTAVIVLAGVGIIALIIAIAYGIYRFFTPEYFEDDLEYEDDDDFFEEEDFFEDEEEPEEDDEVIEDVFEEE